MSFKLKISSKAKDAFNNEALAKNTVRSEGTKLLPGKYSVRVSEITGPKMSSNDKFKGWGSYIVKLTEPESGKSQNALFFLPLKDNAVVDETGINMLLRNLNKFTTQVMGRSFPKLVGENVEFTDYLNSVIELLNQTPAALAKLDITIQVGYNNTHSKFICKNETGSVFHIVKWDGEEVHPEATHNDGSPIEFPSHQAAAEWAEERAKDAAVEGEKSGMKYFQRWPEIIGYGNTSSANKIILSNLTHSTTDESESTHVDNWL